MKVISHLLREEEYESGNKMYFFNNYLLCILCVRVRHGRERPRKTGQKIQGNWQLRGGSGPVVANWSRSGSDQGLRTPPVNVFLLVCGVRVETGQWGWGEGQMCYPSLPEECSAEILMQQRYLKSDDV